MAKDLNQEVEQFRTRPLDAGPYSFVAADALTMKVREAGRVVKAAVLVATGVNAEGYREILGPQVNSTEDGAGWLSFYRDLVARGQSGVKLVTSDALDTRRVDPHSRLRAWADRGAASVETLGGVPGSVFPVSITPRSQIINRLRTPAEFGIKRAVIGS